MEELDIAFFMLKVLHMFSSGLVFKSFCDYCFPHLILVIPITHLELVEPSFLTLFLRHKIETSLILRFF